MKFRQVLGLECQIVGRHLSPLAPKNVGENRDNIFSLPTGKPESSILLIRVAQFHEHKTHFSSGEEKEEASPVMAAICSLTPQFISRNTLELDLFHHIKVDNSSPLTRYLI